MLFEENYNQVAGLAIDAYQARFSTPETLQMAQVVCKKNGAILIVDETKTAGRVEKLGIAEQLGLSPDLRVLGKAMANGAAISILVGHSAFTELASTLKLGGTYGKELFSLHCAQITLDIMQSSCGYKVLCGLGQDVANSINEAFETAGISRLASIEALFGGSMIELVFAPSLAFREDLRRSLKKHLISQGVLLLEGHPSFLCLQHSAVNHDDLTARAVFAGSAWRETIHEL